VEDKDRAVDAFAYDSLRVRMRLRKFEAGLCQTCVTYPQSPGVDTSIYTDMLKQIVVSGSRRYSSKGAFINKSTVDTAL
jgi:hypothetical protein